MRVLIADTYYDHFLSDYHRTHPELKGQPYAVRHAHLMAQRFGTGDAYARELRRLGCEAETVVLNAEALQRQWALEHDVTVTHQRTPWLPEVFIAQVQSLRPDVLYIQEISIAGDAILKTVKPHTRAIVGQIACSLPRNKTFAHHDLILSSWPPIVEHFRTNAMPANALRLGFDAGALDDVANTEIKHDLTFVGGLSPVHTDRIALLESLCERTDIDIFGYGIETIPEDSIIHAHHRGPAWGLHMYETLAGSAIVLNAHGDIDTARIIVRRLANNMRLFEATGMGSLLITDDKLNLHEYFTPGKEVVTYRSHEECAELIQYYLEHDDQRAAIARAGQRRTLSEHTYAHRMRDLVDILSSFLRRPKPIVSTTTQSVAVL